MIRTSGDETASPIARWVLVAMLALVLWLAFRVVRPYLDPLVLAAVLAGLLHPLHAWLRDRLRGRSSLAAIVVCAVVVALIVGPLVGFGAALVRQGVDSLHAIQAWVAEGGLDRALSSGLAGRAGELLRRYLPGAAMDSLDLETSLARLSQTAATWLLHRGGALLGGAGVALGKLALMIFVLFYFLRDGEALLGRALHLLPLRRSQEERLIRRFKDVSRSAILGAFGTAAAQGIAGGIGLAIVGIPALFWGAAMALASLVPVVGTALVWVPAAAWLLLTGHWGKALFLAGYCAIVVGAIDNLLRPLLMSGQARMSTLWLFLAILGGIDAFGLLGIVYGPLVFGLLAVLLYLYEEEFHDFLARQDAS